MHLFSLLHGIRDTLCKPCTSNRGIESIALFFFGRKHCFVQLSPLGGFIIFFLPFFLISNSNFILLGEFEWTFLVEFRVRDERDSRKGRHDE